MTIDLPMDEWNALRRDAERYRYLATLFKLSVEPYEWWETVEDSEDKQVKVKRRHIHYRYVIDPDLPLGDTIAPTSPILPLDQLIDQLRKEDHGPQANG